MCSDSVRLVQSYTHTHRTLSYVSHLVVSYPLPLLVPFLPPLLRLAPLPPSAIIPACCTSGSERWTRSTKRRITPSLPPSVTHLLYRFISLSAGRGCGDAVVSLLRMLFIFILHRTELSILFLTPYLFPLFCFTFFTLPRIPPHNAVCCFFLSK